jgi:hypothetical protein
VHALPRRGNSAARLAEEEAEVARSAAVEPSEALMSDITSKGEQWRRGAALRPVARIF